MKAALTILMCLLAGLELFALVFAYRALSRGASGVTMVSVAIAVVTPLIGLAGVAGVYRRLRGMG